MELRIGVGGVARSGRGCEEWEGLWSGRVVRSGRVCEKWEGL